MVLPTKSSSGAATSSSPASARGPPRLKDLSNSSCGTPNGNGQNHRKQGNRVDVSSTDPNYALDANSPRKKRRASISMPRGLGNGDARMPASEQVLALVRQYCDLPETERQGSEPAQQIQDMTGYAMAGKETLRPVNRDEFLVNIQPTVREMEKQKKIDVDEARNATNCDVRKGKSGRYEYFDGSGERVCSEEYSRRYHAMLASKKRRRLESQATAVSQVQGITAQQKCDSESKRASDDSTMDMSISVDESAIEEDATPDPTRNDDLCEDNGKEVQVVPDTETTDGRSGIDGESGRNGTTHPLLGGLPPSTDPRILMARKKLFQKFDEALSEYSAEVLKIEAERKTDSSAR